MLYFDYFFVCLCVVYVFAEVWVYVYAFKAMGLESSCIALYLLSFTSVY